MKVAIFENEYESVRVSFETANLIYFDNKIDFSVYPSSQSADLTKINDYDVIFIDIDLSSKSELDGYSLIEKITSINQDIGKRIIVLTGNNKIVESLNSRGLYINNLKVIIKPTDYEEVSKNINKVLN
ncbi:response regulator [Flavobacterium zhairuonense]|uniref:response regulator n=1 Tax=Flavobacterium zhairuonense TaxID=2493631 RepID=UPI001052D5C8|nr:response regulator [Flavobacterium zhairuonense]KAF2515885.1 response regulator [Flavobacterium zhairuonense]